MTALTNLSAVLDLAATEPDDGIAIASLTWGDLRSVYGLAVRQPQGEPADLIAEARDLAKRLKRWA